MLSPFSFFRFQAAHGAKSLGVQYYQRVNMKQCMDSFALCLDMTDPVLMLRSHNSVTSQLLLLFCSETSVFVHTNS